MWIIDECRGEIRKGAIENHTTTPPSYRHPTMVVPVLVALGRGTPWAWRAALRSWFEKSKPTISMMATLLGLLEGPESRPRWPKDKPRLFRLVAFPMTLFAKAELDTDCGGGSCAWLKFIFLYHTACAPSLAGKIDCLI